MSKSTSTKSPKRSSHKIYLNKNSPYHRFNEYLTFQHSKFSPFFYSTNVSFISVYLVFIFAPPLWFLLCPGFEPTYETLLGFYIVDLEIYQGV